MKKAKILLVDDDPLFLSLTRKALGEAACLEKIRTATHVKDAREYLDFCVEGEIPFPDAIFLDINMPGIGGMDFADLYSRRYAHQFPDTKLVILTASSNPKDELKAMKIPAVDAVLQKPLTVEKLNDLLLGD
jgi:CheY-like chemotaxis protein